MEGKKDNGNGMQNNSQFSNLDLKEQMNSLFNRINQLTQDISELKSQNKNIQDCNKMLNNENILVKKRLRTTEKRLDALESLIIRNNINMDLLANRDSLKTILLMFSVSLNVTKIEEIKKMLKDCCTKKFIHFIVCSIDNIVHPEEEEEKTDIYSKLIGRGSKEKLQESLIQFFENPKTMKELSSLINNLKNKLIIGQEDKDGKEKENIMIKKEEDNKNVINDKDGNAKSDENNPVKMEEENNDIKQENEGDVNAKKEKDANMEKEEKENNSKKEDDSNKEKDEGKSNTNNKKEENNITEKQDMKKNITKLLKEKEEIKNVKNANLEKEGKPEENEKMPEETKERKEKEKHIKIEKNNEIFEPELGVHTNEDPEKGKESSENNEMKEIKDSNKSQNEQNKNEIKKRNTVKYLITKKKKRISLLKIMIYPNLKAFSDTKLKISMKKLI